MTLLFTEYGLQEDNLSKQEMSDILKALINSKNTVKEDEVLRKVVIIINTPTRYKKSM